MKTIAALLVLGVLALASAGASGARGALKPPPGSPDPAQAVLRSSDVGGVHVLDQGYYKNSGTSTVISYYREFLVPHPAGTQLSWLEDDATVTQSTTIAHQLVAGLRRYVTTAAGRATYRKWFATLDGSSLGVSQISVGSTQNLGVAGGYLLPVTFKMLGRTTHAVEWVFNVGPLLDDTVIFAIPGHTVSRSATTHLASIVARRFQALLAPVNTATPTITGTPAVGQSLTAGTGSWRNGPTRYLVQWSRCDAGGANCTPIDGATDSTYVVGEADAGDTLRVTVQAANGYGAASATSPPTVAVVPAPANIGAPVIVGTPAVGQTLTVSAGVWTNNPTALSFEWFRCDTAAANCVPVASASPSPQSYTVTAADVGTRLVVAVTARNSGGSATVSSPPTGVVAAA